MAPPSRLRSRRPLSISFAGPARIEPAGAPSAFDRQNITVSTLAAISLTGLPSGGGRIEDARAIHVDGNACVGARSQMSSIDLLRVDAAAGHIVSVLDFNAPVAAECGPPAFLRRARIRSQVRMPSRLPRRGSGSRRTTPAWRVPNRADGRGNRNHFLAVFGEELDSDRVAHRAGGNEKGGFLANDFRRAPSSRLTVGSSP